MAKQENLVVDEMLTKPSAVSPTLFVGLGGCGCKIVVRVAKHLKRRHDYDERFKDLVKFALVDTNINDLEGYREEADESFLISDFEKEEYANFASGLKFVEADPYFTQWVPQNYRFRAGDTAGAGQIRIESRLGCYYQMKHGDFVPRFRRLLESLKSHEHGHRRLDTSEIRIVICYSVAGGTGSGSHLTLAYMLRDQAAAMGKPSMIGVSVLPGVFEDKTGTNKDGTFANGYAALKEAEHLMKLGAPESRFFPEQGLEFHYDPPTSPKSAGARQALRVCLHHRQARKLHRPRPDQRGRRRALSAVLLPDLLASRPATTTTTPSTSASWCPTTSRPRASSASPSSTAPMAPRSCWCRSPGSSTTAPSRPRSR